MEDSIGNKTKAGDVRMTKLRKPGKMVSEEEIRRRAYDFYQMDGGSLNNELDDWFRAEKELEGSDQ